VFDRDTQWLLYRGVVSIMQFHCIIDIRRMIRGYTIASAQSTPTCSLIVRHVQCERQLPGGVYLASFQPDQLFHLPSSIFHNLNFAVLKDLAPNHHSLFLRCNNRVPSTSTTKSEPWTWCHHCRNVLCYPRWE
jgi:hypothetical protein